MISTSSSLPIKNPLLAFVRSESKEGGPEALRTLLRADNCFTPADAKKYDTTPLIELVKQFCNQVEDEVEPGSTTAKDMVQLVANSPANMINAVNSEGVTALGLAIKQGDQELLACLIENGADPLISCRLRVGESETTAFESVLMMSLAMGSYEKLTFLAKQMAVQFEGTAEAKITVDPRVTAILKKLEPGQRSKIVKFANNQKMTWLNVALSSLSTSTPAKVVTVTPTSTPPGGPAVDSKEMKVELKKEATVSAASAPTPPGGPRVDSMEVKIETKPAPAPKVDTPVECRDSKRFEGLLMSFRSIVNFAADVEKITTSSSEWSEQVRVEQKRRRHMDTVLSEMGRILDELKAQKAQFLSPSPLDYLSPAGQTALGIAIAAANHIAKTAKEDSALVDALIIVKKLLNAGVSVWTKFRSSPGGEYIQPLFFLINQQTTGQYSHSTRAKELKIIHLLLDQANFSQIATVDLFEKMDLTLFALECFKKETYKNKYEGSYHHSDEKTYETHNRLMSRLINELVLSVPPADGIPSFDELARSKGFDPLMLAFELENPYLAHVIASRQSSLNLPGEIRGDTPLIAAIRLYANSRNTKGASHADAKAGLELIDMLLNKWKTELIHRCGFYPCGWSPGKYEGDSPLGFAMNENLPEVVTRLLSHGALPDMRYAAKSSFRSKAHKKETAIQHTALLAIGESYMPSINPSALIEPLLRAGAKGLSSHETSKMGEYVTPNETPIGMVAKELNAKELKDTAKRDNLIAAAHAYLTHPETVKEWLNIELKDYAHESPLGHFFLTGQIELVRKLVLAGVTLGQTFSTGVSDVYPIQHACALQNIELILLMLERPDEQLQKNRRMELNHVKSIFVQGGVKSENDDVFHAVMNSSKFGYVLGTPALAEEMVTELIRSGIRPCTRLNFLLKKSIPLSQKSLVSILTALKGGINGSNQVEFDQAFQTLQCLLDHPQMKKPPSESKLNLTDEKMIALFDKQSSNPMEHILKPFVEGVAAIYRISGHFSVPVKTTEGSRKIKFGDLASVNTALFGVGLVTRAANNSSISSSSSSSTGGLFGGTAFNPSQVYSETKAKIEEAIKQVNHSKATMSYNS